MKLISTFLFVLLYGHFSFCQTPNEVSSHLELGESLSLQKQVFYNLIVNENIVLPEDSLESISLLSSINSFLSSAQSNSENDVILAGQEVETQILIDEIWDIQKSDRYKDNSFFKPYLTNVVLRDNGSYGVHISYIGTKGNISVLKASFELIAHKIDNQFWISSPLLENTKNWSMEEFQGQKFYFPYTLDKERVLRINSLTSMFDQKLNNLGGSSTYYLCSDELSPLKIFGVSYKSDYNGKKMNVSWSSTVDNRSIYVMNDNRFYNYPEHDLWHFRLSQVISRKEVHRRVDCHIATLYGGIWGIGWSELFPMFYGEFDTGNNVDWLKHKWESSHFITKERRKNYTDDFIGALIIQEIELKIGFTGVWQLLKTKRSKEETEYFEVLDNLLGINKDNYNREVQKLIDAEMKKLSNFRYERN